MSNKDDDTSSMRVETPAHQWWWWQWHHHNNGKDACTSMMATTPLLQGQQCQLNAQWTTCVYFFSSSGWLFEQNRFVPTFPTRKGRSGQRQLYWFQCDAKQSCTPLDWLGGGGHTSRRGKNHIGNFGLATNLSLFFLGRFCILCCVPQKKHLFLVGNDYLLVKKAQFTPYLLLTYMRKETLSKLRSSCLTEQIFRCPPLAKGTIKNIWSTPLPSSKQKGTVHNVGKVSWAIVEVGKQLEQLL